MLTLCEHVPLIILSNMSIYWMVNERMNGLLLIGKTGHQFKLKHQLSYLQSFFLSSLGLKAGKGVIRESIKKEKNCSKYIMCIIRWFLTRHCHNNAHSARQYEQGVNRPISISIACKTVRKESTWGRIMLQEQSLLICLLYQNLGYEWWFQDLWCFCDG